MGYLDQPTRRLLLKSIAGVLGVGAIGSTLGHPGAGDHGEDHFHPPEDKAGTHQALYDGLGAFDADYHYGGISELKVQGDYAFVGILSSKDPTIDRGLAILDVKDFTQADSEEALKYAEPRVISFVPNENNAVSVMDVKLSSDGNYAFLSKQPVAVLFNDGEPRTEPGNIGNSPESGSLQAVDVSDPYNPEIVGRWDGWGLGPHNSDHLQIGGQDYVFAVKGPTGEPAGIYVVEFDRDTGRMQLVNFWLDSANFGAGEFEDITKGTELHGNDYYAHDIAVERDPKTGQPIAYLANWNQGGRVLDVSDPREIRELGRFQQQRCHEIWPITVTTDDGDKRLYVTGQENPNSHFGTADGETGYIYVIDADPVDAVLAGDEDGPVDLGKASNRQSDDEDRPSELAKWLLSNNVIFDNYVLSAHNLEPFEVEINNKFRQFIAVGHYHAGVRILEFSEALGNFKGQQYIDHGLLDEETAPEEEPDEEGLLGTDLQASEGREAPGTDSSPVYNGDDGLGEVAYFRSHEEGVPTEAKMAGLTEATPDFWCAVEANGIVFASGINTGVYGFTVGRDDEAPTAPNIPVGSDRPIDVSVDRASGASLYLGGQTARFTLTVETDEPVRIRDRVPTEWTVYDDIADVVDTTTVGDGTLVDLGTVEDGDSVTYFANVGNDSDSYTIGEVQYSKDGREWLSVAGTVDTNGVIGP